MSQQGQYPTNLTPNLNFDKQKTTLVSDPGMNCFSLGRIELIKLGVKHDDDHMFTGPRYVYKNKFSPQIKKQLL